MLLRLLFLLMTILTCQSVNNIHMYRYGTQASNFEIF